MCINPCIAQAPVDRTGEIVMKTNKGSFKILSQADKKAFGKIQMSFKGTILIVGYEGTAPITTTPGLRVEYKNDKYARIEYFGEGTLTLDGKFRAIQWFGKNLNMFWSGLGICRVYGEFDKNNETGTYAIKGEPVRYWGSGGTTFTVPARVSSSEAPPVIIKKGGG